MMILPPAPTTSHTVTIKPLRIPTRLTEELHYDVVAAHEPQGATVRVRRPRS